ncbi:metalloprotease [Coemansia erecta]|uniref:Metalloprotease n=1 Tax=Coemansia erecta TaxID=147472 RepID=A0A9W8CS66_9FUNG|nr:metalloprotease [Coemansia erecta]
MIYEERIREYMDHPSFTPYLDHLGIGSGSSNGNDGNKVPTPARDAWKTQFEIRKTVDSGLPYYEYTGVIEKSPTDPRQFRLIRLLNNMTVLCAHDPDSVDSAASLSVNVGHQHNPPEFLGLAHFLEHMLFQGSEKYPGENSYNKHISTFSGYDNAFTSDIETCYHFALANDGFEGALDRFSRFFIDPLLNASSVDKELLAVDSEHKGNIQNDGWRWYALLKRVSNPDHPFSQFGTGTTETLGGSASQLGVSLRDELLKFHQKYYSSDIMNLVVAGNHTLDLLTEWTVSKFSQVRSLGNPKIEHQAHPLSRSEVGQLVHMERVDDGQDMALIFALPEIKSTYRSGAIAYISYLLRAQGKGSLYHYLQHKGWITDISGLTISTNSDGFNLFIIGADLTLEGLEHRDEIVHAIFAYLNMMAATKPQEWYHNELRTSNNLDHYFYQKSSVHSWVTRQSGILHNAHILPEYVMTAGSLIGEFDADMVSRLLGLLKPSNYMMLISAKQHKDADLNMTDPFYGTKYHVGRLPTSLTKSPGSGFKYRKLFSMPKPNPFIPTGLGMDLQLSNPAVAPADPVYLKRTDKMAVWFKKDDQFFTPRGAIHIKIKVPLTNTPFHHALNELYSMYIDEVMYNELQQAMLAGFHFHYTPTAGTINIHITGFSENQRSVLDAMLRQVKSLTIDAQLFSVLYEKLADSYSAIRTEDPLSHANMVLGFINRHPSWYYTHKQAELKKITAADLQLFADHILDQTFSKILIIGDFEEEEALSISHMVDSILNSEQLPEHLTDNARALSIDPGYYVHQTLATDENAKNSAVVSHIYCGSILDDYELVVLELLVRIIREPFFDQLRTKEQLGYQVGAQSKSFGTNQILAFYIQGESNPAYAGMRIDRFADSFRQHLVDYDPRILSTKIDSIAEKWSDKPKTIFQEAKEHWSQISSGNYEFNQKDKHIALLKTLNRDDLVRFWDKYINTRTARMYRRIDSQIWSSKTLKPSSEQFAQFHSGSIALQGCLHRDGATNVALSKVNDIVRLASQSGNIDGALASLQDQFNVQVGANSQISVALQMAVDQVAASPSFAAINGLNLTKIGMSQSPSGIWLINDIRKFKNSQQLLGSSLPFQIPEPKYLFTEN